MSKFIRHCECPVCGSKDNGALYDDGHIFCFSCAKVVGDNPELEATQTLAGPAKSLEERGINKDTAKTYGVTEANGVVTYPYGDVVKLRKPGKVFSWPNGGASLLFGQDVFPAGGKMVLVTEGEYDAMAAYQMLGHKVPCVSVPNGAKAALKDCQKSFEWLDSFDNIVLAFDSDEPGQAAVDAVAELFGSKIKIVKHANGFKDANEYLMQASSAKFVAAFWAAEQYIPYGIISIDEVIDRLKLPDQEGIPWAFPTLTALTHGRRYGEVYLVGGGVGCGKTDFFTQQIAADLERGENVGIVYLEQPVKETAVRIAGKTIHKQLHIKDGRFTEEEYWGALEKLKGRVWLFEHFGSKDWETIAAKVRYMHKAMGVKMFYIDHITALVADEDDERRALDRIMANMASLGQSEGIIIHAISHLSTPADGKSHEEGARVRARDFTGSRALARWAHYMFGIERNTQADDPIERHTTKVRVVKDRYTGQATGEVFHLRYDSDTGMMNECEAPEEVIL